MTFTGTLTELLTSESEDSILFTDERVIETYRIEEFRVDGSRQALRYHQLKVPPISVSLIHNACIQISQGAEGQRSGINVFTQDGELIDSCFQNANTALSAPVGRVFTQNNDTCYVFLGEIVRHYGHFLLETLARFWLLDYLRPGNVTLLIYKNYARKTAFIDELFKLIDHYRFQVEEITMNKKQLIVPRLLVPQPMLRLGKYCHESYGDHLRRLFTPVLSLQQDSPKKLYISRRRLGSAKRSLINEEEIERIFSAYGFEIIHPQELDLSTQLQLFFNADYLAGMEGSGLHNLLFSQSAKGLIVFSVDRTGRPKAWNMQQLTICVAEQVDTYLIRMEKLFAIEGVNDRLFSWYLNPGQCMACLTALFGDNDNFKIDSPPALPQIYARLAACLRELGKEKDSVFFQALAAGEIHSLVDVFRCASGKGKLTAVDVYAEDEITRKRRRRWFVIYNAWKKITDQWGRRH